MRSDSESAIPVDVDAEPAVLPDLAIVLEPHPPAATPATAEPRRRSMLFLVGSLVSGNLVSMALGLLGGILQARCVPPATLGLFAGLGLVLGYAPYLHLGVLNGVNRELPYFVGKGDRRRVNELASAAQAWAILLGVFVASVLAGVAIWQAVYGTWELTAGWATYAVLGFLLFYNTNYLQMTYRTGHDFARLAMAKVVENSLGLVLVGLVALWSFYGICLRSLLSGLVGAAVLYYWRPLRIGPQWDWAHWTHLLKIGFPIFVVSLVYGVWPVMNSTLVLKYMKQEGLGLYSLVLVAGSAYEMLSAAVCQVIYPRMAEQYGRTGRVGGLVRMAILPSIASVVCTGLAVLAGWWLVEPAIRLVLPNYLDAAPAVRWTLLASLAFSGTSVANIYNVVKRQDLYLVAILLGIGAYYGSLRWLLRDGASLVAFPQAMLIGRSVMVMACYAFVPLLLRHDRVHPAHD